MFKVSKYGVALLLQVVQLRALQSHDKVHVGLEWTFQWTKIDLTDSDKG